MTSLLNDRRAVDIVYLDFRKVFGAVNYKILTDKFMQCHEV